MKKQIFLIIGLILGFSIESLAGTGGAKDGFMFFAVVIGFLLFVWVLLAGGNYLRKNRKRLIRNSISFFSQLLKSLAGYINKLKELIHKWGTETPHTKWVSQ